MIYLTKASCYYVDLNMHSWKWSNAENGFVKKGEEYCFHALMNSREIDKMCEETFDLLLLSSTCNKFRNTEGSCKALPFSKINYIERSNMYFKSLIESSFKGIYAAIKKSYKDYS